MTFISANLDLLNTNCINEEFHDNPTFIDLNNKNHLLVILFIILSNIIKIITNLYALLIIIAIKIYNKDYKSSESILMPLLMLLGTLQSTLNNFKKQYKDKIQNEYKLQLLKKEKNNFTLCALMNQNYEYYLNKNLNQFSMIWNNIDNNIVPFFLFMIVFLIYFWNTDFLMIMVFVLLLFIINLQFFLFELSKQIPWRTVKYLRNLCISYKNQYNKTHWGSFLLQSNINIIINLFLIIIIINKLLTINQKIKDLDLNIIFILLTSLSKPLLYNCLHEHYNIINKYNSYLWLQESTHNHNQSLFFENFSCNINNKPIFNNISFSNNVKTPILLKGYGKHQLLCGLFQINSKYYSGKCNHQSLDKTYFIRYDFYTSSMTLREYLKMDFPNYNDEQLIDLLNNINIFENQMFINPLNNKYNNKYFSQEMRFLIDICKSLRKKDSLIIIENPMYILDEWMELWSKNNNQIIILTNNNQMNFSESHYTVINLKQ
jgi:hypothetical protein